MAVTENIGRYKTERVLGSGAFATVWLAVDEALDAKVAIKVLAENWAHDEDVRRRFTEEARILWRADSDHIVRVHTVEELPDGRPYFVMAFADRGSLGDRMTARAAESRPWSVDEAVDLALQMADGLAVAHRLQIAHRDLKPSNVLFQSVPEHQGSGERLVLADFGIARSLAASRGTTIATGTPQYMAPEQAEGRADERSDLYSAAVILYELLAGTTPYPYDTLGRILRAQREDAVAPLSSRRADVPAALDGVVAKAMSIDPSGRPASAEEWASDLRAGREGRPPVGAVAGAAGMTPVLATMGPEELARQAAADPIPPPPPPGPPPAPPTPAGGGSPPPRKRAKRGPWLAIGGLVAVGLVVGLLAVMASSGDEGSTPTVGELLLEPISDTGPEPFTGSLVPELPAELPSPEDILGTVTLPSLPGADAALPKVSGDPAASISGAAPGLYGGTTQLSVCDAKQLVDFLERNAEKAAAWAGVIGIPVDEIGVYVDDLTDVILQFDVRVSNHGFSNGKATERQSVLEAGTAVLVDTLGVPRVRCFCGNPLTPSKEFSSPPKIKGVQWPGFSIDSLITIQATDPVDQFVIQDLISGEILGRDPGSPIDEAVILETLPGGGFGEETSTTTTAPPVEVPIVSASPSSTFSGEFPASLALDGQASTSWFSAGGGSASYEVLLDGTYAISEVTVVGNGGHPEFPTGFGFGSVTMQILVGTEVVSEQTFDLPGTPDPTVTFTPGVAGTGVRLLFRGGENSTCGGFSDIFVTGSFVAA